MDPFSVAGSAVGVTSLGLQVCQALIRYYGNFRSFHDEIDAVVRRTESLMENLQALESLKVRMGNDEVSVRLQKTMDTVTLALNRLNEHAKRCGEAGVPDNPRARARLVTKRLLWPFRQDTLLYLQDTLDRTQANLALALQILGLGVAHVHLEALEEVKNTLMNQNDIIEIERGNRSIEVDLIHNQSSRLSSQLSAIERKLDLLVLPNVSAIYLGGLRYSSSNEVGHVETLLPLLNQSAESHRKSLREIGHWKSMQRPKCHCRYYARKQVQIKSSVSRWFLLPIHTEEASDHFPSCPYFANANHMHTIEAQFILRITRTWNYHVKAGWIYAQRSSWSTISPVLRFRPVVPTSSPGFKPLQDLIFETLQRSIREGPFTDRHKREWKFLLSQALNTVRNNFKQQRASPLDVGADGRSILSVSHRSWFSDVSTS
ncbi:hypothetical protein K469DRAFT_673444 [Zopfia rhizophila CBS 207.26]|uniref:Fungal N-terminal domain-containing protein n=1 Tax=Zopfia rhizophila CBS 207.26 TaxID=1314779 RepID=A0A6A6DP45_9PEZI|nr:hypothetical protein K469DRAFT_673444 [Zopfia rhizophila CBS 207.26]